MENPACIGQKVSWCVKVIHNASIRAKKKKQKWVKDSLVLNSPVEDSAEILNWVKCQRAAEVFETAELIETLKTLPEMQSRVLIELFCDGYSQEEVAEHLGTSQQQVSRLKARGLNTLKAGMRSGQLL